MPSVNEELADRFRIQAVSFERFAADVRRRVLALLLEMEADLIEQIRRIDPTEPLRLTYRAARLAKLLEQTRASIVEGYKAVNKEMNADLVEVADISASATVLAVNEVVGAEIMTVALAPEMFRALVDDTMILGAPSKEWWGKQAGDAVFRFKAAVQQGYAQGETVEQIVRRVKGTRAANYRDGAMEVTRRNATSLVHTSVQAISNSARREVFDENSDIISGKVQLSTLDNRTTSLCMAYSGKAFRLDGTPIGHSLPYNGGCPRHYRCRSVELPLLKDIDDIPEGKAKKVNGSTQASMDGQVPSDIDYESWLKTRNVQFQKDVLGEGKWQLWTDKKITFTDLVDQTGRELTLAELRANLGL